MSIFISIASYRDPELIRTIKSAIDNAAKPNELYFGIVVQEFDKDIPDLSWIKNAEILIMHPKDARGAGYARAIAMDRYDNQDYYLQVDYQWERQVSRKHYQNRRIKNSYINIDLKKYFLM